MIQDTFKSFKSSDNCLFLKGNACELTISFEDFSQMIDALRKDFVESNGTKPVPRLFPLANSQATKG